MENNPTQNESVNNKREISIYDPIDFPFGLLSSKNITEFTMTGKERPWGKPDMIKGTWKSVTQFVYVNMFSETNRRSQIKASLPLAFNTMNDIQKEINDELFEDFIKIGLYKKITQDKTLTTQLINTRSYDIVYEPFQFVVSVLDQIRYPKNAFIYINKTGDIKFTSLKEAASVLNGVELALFSGVDIDNNYTYEDLLKWSKPIEPEPNMADWLDLNNIIGLAQIRLKNKKIVKDIEEFKDKLLNTYLDYLLETDYPYIDKQFYEQVKISQLKKENQTTIALLKNQAYEIFLTGGFSTDHKNVLSKVKNYQPHHFVTEPYPVKNLEIRDKLNLETLPELTPTYEQIFTIDNKKYKTVLHYVYDMLIQRLMTILPLVNFTLDINSIDIKDLSTIYTQIQKDWTVATLRVNNEAAIEAKLLQHPPLLHLLFQTDPYPIIWNDTKDPILGIFDGSGDNITGKHLMFIRENWNRRKIKNRSMSVNKSLTNNNILMLWLYVTALYLRNTMLLFEYPTTRDLEFLYSLHIDKTIQRLPNPVEQQILESAGMTRLQIKAAFPMILMLVLKEFGTELTSDREIARHVVAHNDAVIKDRLRYDDPEAYEEAFEVSKQYLSIATENIKLAKDVSVYMFVGSMLSGKHILDDEEYTPTYDNLSKWSAVFNYFVVEETEPDYYDLFNLENVVKDIVPESDTKNNEFNIIPKIDKYKAELKFKNRQSIVAAHHVPEDKLHVYKKDIEDNEKNIRNIFNLDEGMLAAPVVIKTDPDRDDDCVINIDPDYQPDRNRQNNTYRRVDKGFIGVRESYAINDPIYNPQKPQRRIPGTNTYGYL